MDSLDVFILTNAPKNYNGTKLRKVDWIMLFARFRVFPIKILLNYYSFLYIIHIKRELGDRYHETYCTNR